MPVRSQSLDFVEGEMRASRDDEIVVGKRRTVVQLDRVLRRLHALGADGREVDLAAF